MAHIVEVDARRQISLAKLGFEPGQCFRVTEVEPGVFTFERVVHVTPAELDVLRRLDAGGRDGILAAFDRIERGEGVSLAELEARIDAAGR